MEHTHFEPQEDLKTTIIMAVLGWSGTFWGYVLAFGADVIKAAILGFVGATFGIVAKIVYQKYFEKHFKK